ncbi:DNA-protecting protein DprA [Candidatus Parcubacteria bacterium]|uniref:DNA-protecting protein DprA n=1 Tax=Candidatus Kaiserbacteria bacterium CG10_big_fil_rev_8_21_14_0_10_47_16 TaxID=1974608 RepID=A0A2H0UCV4_9BACT|nr:DNA-protecting protein DprA [Candidatus Parcubacteria bacterium]PIR84248.1 MAG: DNA-protecting protein DprA [Candidatus Kaiserbacteria bacterium CG10_big_fil_rev_8_21_14_0_10_47_16]
MDFPISKLAPEDVDFPPLLREIPEVPKCVYVRGELPPRGAKLLAVVGSRNYTDYGRRSIETLIAGLRGYNVGIVSGLALGIDGIAHEAALDAGLYTLAVPGSGLNDEVIYPRRHKLLAKRILESGGGLLSEYEPDFRATVWSFPRRNRVMAGLTHATLVVEASEKSGTLITSRLATDYNRDVLTIPGSIFSENSRGPHMLIRLGATPVTCAEDILEALHLEVGSAAAKPPRTMSTDEEKVFSLLASPADRDSVIRALGLDASTANILLMQMEIDGIIRDENGVLFRHK